MYCQWSGSARLMGGSGTVRLAVGGVWLIFGSARPLGAGASLVTVLEAGGGSWVLSSVSTCSAIRLGQQGRTRHTRRRRTPGYRCAAQEERSRRTQSFFQGLDISALGAALSSHLVVGAVVAQPHACTTTRPVAVAPQLPLPTYHTCQTLRLGHVGVVGGLRWGNCGILAAIAAAASIHLHGHGVCHVPIVVHGDVHVLVWSGHGDAERAAGGDGGTGRRRDGRLLSGFVRRRRRGGGVTACSTSTCRWSGSSEDAAQNSGSTRQGEGLLGN